MLKYSNYLDSSANYMSTKIQQLLETWPDGMIRTVSSLKDQGYTQSLINHYRSSGWLESIGSGVVIKGGNQATVFSAVQCLQNELKLNVRIGGLSALELQGYAHYLRFGKSPLHIFGNVKRLPAWIRNYQWEQEVRYHSTSLFTADFKDGLKDFKFEGLSVRISNPIKAIFEYLSLVPKQHGIEEAKELMNGLTSLVPSTVQRFLTECNSYKVKRLFLLLAEQTNHQWFSMIESKSVDLGKGVMSIEKGGRYSEKYKLVVPKSIFMHEGNE
jgi:hypothetical protein